jgi:CheY-like chemotaxis protein
MKKKILIVDDNKDSREIVGLFVTKFGHQVIKASNSQEAIASAEAECPDLIFMDLDLPDADGIKTTAILKKNPKTSHIPVVAVTAWISALSEERAAKVGIVTYLIKPVSPQTLKETIEEYTRGSLNQMLSTQNLDNKITMEEAKEITGVPPDCADHERETTGRSQMG